VQHYGSITMVDAMNVKTPTIFRLTKQYGQEKIIQGVAKMFIGTSLYFDKALSADEAETIVVECLSDYELSNLKLEDFAVICKELKEDKIYGKLTMNKILNHVKSYRDRRTQQAIAQSLDETQTAKMYGNDINERIHRGIRDTSKDKTNQIDRTRADVKKYYK
jgi:hypothetical protein